VSEEAELGSSLGKTQENLLQTLGKAVVDLLATTTDSKAYRQSSSLKQHDKSHGQSNDMSGGLSEVLELVERILKDGSKCVDYRGREECRSFVLEESGTQTGLFGSSSIEGWLQLQLSNQSLSLKLRDLYSDRGRLEDHYRDQSVSVNPVYRQTFLLILEALEQMDLSRLTALDLSFQPTDEPELQAELSDVAVKSARKAKQHKRSVSCPILQDQRSEESKAGLGASNWGDDYLDVIEDLMNIDHSDDAACTEKSQRIQPTSANLSSTPAGKLPPLLQSPNNSSLGPSCNSVSINHSSSKSGVAALRMTNNSLRVFKKGHTRAVSDSGIVWAALRDTQNQTEELDSSQDIKGFWSEVVPATSGCVQKPKANQSLVSYLSESGGEGNRKGRRAQLDRENAHFILSEAMIGTLEQLNFDTSMKSIEEEEGEEESDDEIRVLKQKLRIRREEIYAKERRSRVKRNRRGHKDVGILSDGKTDTATTDQSGSTDYNSNDSEEFERMLDSNDEEFSKFEPGSKNFLGALLDIPEGSAESIALSLLGLVGAGRLPPADQLPWLVTEEDAPQQLLPLPDSLPVDPDEELKGATELRGNHLWAPPRPQLILTVQYKPKNRKAAMYQQRWQCTGCGMRVEQKYSNSFRLCNYLGKFFCTGCHENSTAIIPARVIQDWNFERFPVSNFSLDILNSVYTEPVFNIHDLNPGIIRRKEKLKVVCNARIQLNKLLRYINTCRFASNIKEKLEGVSCSNPYLFSMEELYQTRFQKMGLTLRNMVADGLKHVQCCHLCQARGFICEGCRAETTIFPFQNGVHECSQCFSCYHNSCFSHQYGCSKCFRVKLRKEATDEEESESQATSQQSSRSMPSGAAINHISVMNSASASSGF